MKEPYSITQRDCRWIISTEREDVLACRRLSSALTAVKDAVRSLIPAQAETRSNVVFPSNFMPKVTEKRRTASDTSLSKLHAVALQYGWEIQQDGDRYYLRTCQPETFHDTNSQRYTGPTNHLPFFRTLAEVRRFLVGE